MFWIAGPVVYAIVSAFAVLQKVRSYDLLVILARYVILLPALVWALRRGGAKREPWTAPRWWTTAGAFSIAAAILSYATARGITVTDESAYLFQSRIFLTGHLFAPPLPGASANPAETPPELYYEQHILTPAGWTTKYYPGWPALLAPFTAAHLAWLLNPLLAFALLALVHALARRWTDERTARVAVLLMALSPYLLARSIGYMSDLFCAAMVAGVWLLAARGMERRSFGAFAGAFALMAAAVLTRPFTAFAVAVALALTLFLLLSRDRRFLAMVLALGAVFAAAAYVGLRSYNRAITGDPAVSPYAMSRGAKEVAELNLNPATIWDGFLHENRRELEATLANTFPFLFLLAVRQAWARRRDRRMLSLALLFPVVCLFELLQPAAAGGLNGNRFYVEALFAVAILAAAAVSRLNAGRGPALAMVGVQAVAMGVSVPAILSAALPFARVYEFSNQLPQPRARIIFLRSKDGFDAFHANWNTPQWPAARNVYLIDPGPGRREEVAERFGRPHFAVITYDDAGKAGRVLEMK